MPRLNKSQFATRLKLSRTAIGKAVAAGAVICINGEIDTDHPTNKSYAEIDRSAKKEAKQAVVVKPDKPEPEKKGDSGDKKPAGKTSAKSKTKIIDYSTAGIMPTKTEVDIGRGLVITAKEKVKLAQLIGTLILREEVEKLFGRLYSIILNFFHPLGQRLAPIVAGICGVTDPVIILKIEKAIDKENMRGLGEFKKEAEKGV